MTETNNLITHFEVSNFKKFDHLVVENIGQFNLITGDNNVGKTCLLEALVFDKRPKNTINWYHNLLGKRELVLSFPMRFNETNDEYIFGSNDFSFFQRDKNLHLPIKFVINDNKFELINTNENLFDSKDIIISKFILDSKLKEYSGIRKKSKNWVVFKENDSIRYLLDLLSDYYFDFITEPEKSNIPQLSFLSFSDKIEDFISVNYDYLFQVLKVEDKFIENINLLFDSVQIEKIQKFNHINPIGNQALFIKTNKKNYHNIREYGDGYVRVTYILLLILTGNKKLFIDEIDTGIHFSKMKELWKSILKLCKELEIQLFATTHSQECIEAYAQALEELGMEEKGRIIMLQEEHKSVKSYTFKSLDEHLDYRG